MKKLILYVHGQGGTAEEAEHYKPLFPDCTVVGLSYQAETPWEAEKEFPAAFQRLAELYDSVILIANSIGAYFSMCALPQEKLEKACFISPIVDMEKLICDMMVWAKTSEAELREKKQDRNHVWRNSLLGVSLLCPQPSGGLEDADQNSVRKPGSPDVQRDCDGLRQGSSGRADRDGKRGALVSYRGTDGLSGWMDQPFRGGQQRRNKPLI